MYRIPSLQGHRECRSLADFTSGSTFELDRYQVSRTRPYFNNTRGANHENRLRHSVSNGFWQVARLLAPRRSAWRSPHGWGRRYRFVPISERSDEISARGPRILAPTSIRLMLRNYAIQLKLC